MLAVKALCDKPVLPLIVPLEFRRGAGGRLSFLSLKRYCDLHLIFGHTLVLHSLLPFSIRIMPVT